MSNKVEVSNGNMGFCSLLAIVFITLKLTGYIAWSWWWVLSPIWIPIVLVLAVFIVALLVSVTLNSK